MTSADFILMEPAEVPGVSSGSWTDQETLLLLEALELFSENWNEIAEHVATKTKTQCILHFLQMPIEDPFLDGNDDASDKVQEQVDPSSDDKETNAPCLQETEEADNADAGDQPISLTTGVPTKEDVSKLEFSCENGTNLPIDALKAAFQAIGLTPEQELPSFAEAGNPVMALAAYLTHLVEPDAAKTSFRSSLKAMSQESPGIQLATRHCFILENPPNDMTDPSSESAVTDMDITESPKEEGQMPTLNKSEELKAPNGSVGSKPSNGSDELKPSNDSDELKPRNDSDELKPSNDSDEPKPLSGSDELKPSSGSVDSKTVDGCVELKPSNGDNKPKSLNGSDESNDLPKNEEGAVPVESEMKLLVPSQDCSQRMMDTMEPSDLDSPMQTALRSTKEPDAALKGEHIIPSDVKNTEESAPPMSFSLTNSKEPGDLTSQGEVAAPNAADYTKVSDAPMEEKPDSVREFDKLAPVDEIEAVSGTTMVVDTKPTLVPSDEPESQQKVVTVPALDGKERTDGGDKKVSPSNNGKDQTPTEINGDHKINKLKRAAATVLSAAAVKAKLLANEEEDQIRQLVSLIIEKQLHKLDTKLALFTEIESGIMRAREQTEKARQKLIHERAQIIAARFGLPAPPARGNPMSLPTGKLAMGHASSSPKPPTTSEKSSPTRRP